MTPKAPRFGFIYDKACEFLLSTGTFCIPVNPVNLIEQSRWGLMTYSELCSVTHAKIDDIIDACRSRDGFTVYKDGNYCIAYNDNVRQKSRVAFTLMHEAGHIICGHFSGRSTTLSTGEYRVFEAEANYFAGNVLAPAAVVNACGFETPALLRAACGLSSRAANVRAAELASYRASSTDDKILKTFSAYIEISNRRSSSQNIDIVCDEASL